MGLVEGVVRLDGKLVPEATVVFQPEHGSTSYGQTDADGHFELMFSSTNPGAVIGRHQVSIGTFMAHEGEPETIPPCYNLKSELVRDVDAGTQNIDFDLEDAGGLRPGLEFQRQRYGSSARPPANLSGWQVVAREWQETGHQGAVATFVSPPATEAKARCVARSSV